jgi:hypothetical protein
LRIKPLLRWDHHLFELIGRIFSVRFPGASHIQTRAIQECVEGVCHLEKGVIRTGREDDLWYDMALQAPSLDEDPIDERTILGGAG